MFISGVNDTGDKLFGGVKTPLTNLLVVSLTPAINLCHGFSLIVGVVDTCDKFTTGVVDTAEKLSPVTTALTINLLPVSTTPVNNHCR
jgi:hypothetical protein